MNSPQPAPRVPLNVSIEFRRNYARISDYGVLRNISISGAFLETNGHRLQEKEKVKLTFNVGGRIRQINAAVIWSREVGAGLKFQPYNNQDLQIVDDLIYFIENQRNSRRNVLASIFDRVTNDLKVDN
ncbi:MAG: PilZ domain-containing protein [Bdellovibrionia bacterium]